MPLPDYCHFVARLATALGLHPPVIAFSSRSPSPLQLVGANPSRQPRFVEKNKRKEGSVGRERERDVRVGEVGGGGGGREREIGKGKKEHASSCYWYIYISIYTEDVA